MDSVKVKKTVSFDKTKNQVYIIPYEDRRNYAFYDVIRERDRGEGCTDEGATIESVSNSLGVTHSIDNESKLNLSVTL